MKKPTSTSPAAARAASRVLRSPATGATSKTAAASTLAQAKPNERTSADAASAASKVLRDGRTGADSKRAAGSALSQRKKA